MKSFLFKLVLTFNRMTLKNFNLVFFAQHKSDKNYMIWEDLTHFFDSEQVVTKLLPVYILLC